MATFFELKHKAETMMTQGKTLAEKLGYSTSAQAIQEIIGTFDKKEMMVVAVGEARRGKSSLLNALLNEKESLFPVDVNVCTNVVTVVRYGEKEKVEVYLETPGKEGYRTETIGREQIADYVSEKGNPDNYKNVKLLNISIPNPLLKEGVVFVDTPGVGSLNIAHAEATYGFLPSADLLLFVSDAGSGLTETELDFLKRGYQYCKNIIFPLTKRDANVNYPIIEEDNREKIHKALGIAKEDIQIISVSSLAKLRYLEKGSKAMYVNSNYPELESAIWTTIAKTRAEILILPFLVDVKQELLKIVDSVAAQYQLLNADQSKTEQLIEELNAEIKRMEDLQQKSSEWRNRLNYFYSLLSNNINAEIQNIGVEARELLEQMVAELDKKICQKSEYSKVISAVNDVISCGMLRIKDRLESEIQGEAQKIDNQLGLDLDINQNALEQLNFVPNEDLVVVFPKKKKMDRVLTGGRKITMNSMGGAAVGGILGGIIGLCVGGPIGLVVGAQYGAGAGTLVGGTKGCVDALSKYDELDIGRVNRAIQQHIATSISSMNTAISNTIAELRLQLISSFEEKLKKRVKELQENVKRMQDNIRLSKTEIPQKLNTLKQYNDLLKKQMDQYEEMETAILKFRDNASVVQESSTDAEASSGCEEDSEPSYEFL
ncbi:dynamin family protein [[Clostridium] leptum]|nr:dynamin family protein [[Clostridium] leptum]